MVVMVVVVAVVVRVTLCGLITKGAGNSKNKRMRT